MSINKKIIQYLDYKHISQINFSKTMGLSEGILRKSNYLGSKYLKKLRSIYPDLNMDWLLFDEGNMIIDLPEGTVSEPYSNYKKNNKGCGDEVILLQKKLLETQEKLIDALELNRVLQQQIQPLKKPDEQLSSKS